MQTANELAGRVAFVTGAAGGLGQAMVRAFASNGAGVALADLASRADELEQLTAELPSTTTAVHLDVRDPASIHAAVRTAADRLGSVDIMVCNAGLNVRRPSLELTAAEWDAVMDVNLRGVFFSAQAGAVQMVQQGHGGKVVSIASIMGLVGSNISGAAYCASKAGVVNLTRELAIEWADQKIQVNAVAPTYVRTPLTAGIFQDDAFLQSVLRRTPNGQLATPESVADAVVFLASPRADMITGTTLPVDGGWTAW